MSRAQVEQMLAESGLDADEGSGLCDALAVLDDLATTPAPSAALTALFEARPVPVAPPAPSAPRKRALAGVIVLAMSGVGATGLSAAANTLPRPLQHHVSEFSRHYLPFDLPEPPVRPARSAPVPSHALPHSVPQGHSDHDEAGTSRSLADRPGAGAPDASQGPAGQHHPPTSSTGPTAQPSAMPAPVSSPSASPTSSPPSKPGTTPSAGPSPVSSDQGKDRGKDRGNGPDKGQDKGQDKGKGPHKPDQDRPRPPGDGNEAPQPDRGGKSGGASGGPSSPMPALPLPPIPVPDVPPVVGLPGNGTDVTVD